MLPLRPLQLADGHGCPTRELLCYNININAGEAGISRGPASVDTEHPDLCLTLTFPSEFVNRTTFNAACGCRYDAFDYPCTVALF